MGRAVQVLGAVIVLGTAVQAGSFVATAASNVDPARKSKYSTANALKPSQMKIKRAPIRTDQGVTVSKIPIDRAGVGGREAPITVDEARRKHVIEPQIRSLEVVKFESETAGELPASVPRIRREQFQKMMSEYAKGTVPMNPFANAEILIDGKTVSIGDINRHAGPRHALEDQGIPVIQAATDDAAEPANPDGRRAAIPGMEEPVE